MLIRNAFKTKDDIFIQQLNNKQLSKLTHQTKKISHTYEFRHSIQHDRNFNNIQKTIKESWAAAIILRNSSVFGEPIYKLSKLLSNIWLKNINTKEFSFFVEKIVADVGKNGQFASVKKHEIGYILSSSVYSAEIFSKKILLIKAFGAFIIDHAIKKPDSFKFLFKHGNQNLDRIIQHNKPDELFAVRGRSGVLSQTYRKDIGILDSDVFDRLDVKLRNILTINKLTKNRPLFRTRISDKLANGNPAFVERMFDLDNPLIASISGSTSCIFIASDVLDDRLKQSQLDQITLSAIALFVGGGYHSVNEIINIRSPHINYISMIETEMKIKNKKNELQEYLSILKVSQDIFIN